MIFPFLSRRLTESLLLAEGETFDDMLEGWKKQVVAQVCALLV